MKHRTNRSEVKGRSQARSCALDYLAISSCSCSRADKVTRPKGQPLIRSSLASPNGKGAKLERNKGWRIRTSVTVTGIGQNAPIRLCAKRKKRQRTSLPKKGEKLGASLLRTCCQVVDNTAA